MAEVALESGKAQERALRRWRLALGIATVLLALVTAFWTFWGVAELFYEGWWGQWYDRLVYLAPGAAFLALSLLVVKWPRLGGALLMLAGGAFGYLLLNIQIGRWGFRLLPVLQNLALTAPLWLGGLFFFVAGRRAQQSGQGLFAPEVDLPSGRSQRLRRYLRRYLRRHWQVLLVVGLPLAVAVAVSAGNLPLVLTRPPPELGAQEVAGHGVTLIWAPAGPGWGRGLQTMAQADALPDGGHRPGNIMSWNRLARHGEPASAVAEALPCNATEAAGCATQAEMEQYGLCRYLSADGTRLLDEPAGIWRMPTIDEIVRSLNRDGRNASCTWDRGTDEVSCRTLPDKEPPLWDPASSAIYYWAGDEEDVINAYYVGYNGQSVHSQPKTYGNPRHGYRCVREP